jgi:hypothetical protein
MAKSEATEFRYSLTAAKTFANSMYLGGGLCLAAGLFLIWLEGWTDQVPAGVAPALVSLLYVAIGIWKMRRAKNDRSPRLIISQIGIQAPDAVNLLLPWSAIRKLVLHRPRNGQSHYLAIDAIHPKQYGPRRNSRYLSLFNKWIGGGTIIVNTGDLECVNSDVKTALRRANPQATIIEK